MDGKGLEKVRRAIPGGPEGMEVVGAMQPEDTHSKRFLSIRAGGNSDPSDVTGWLDLHGLMFHEGQTVTPETEGPVLKYLGSNGCYHAYEDVASK
jgi:hypothetical protein